LHHKKRKQKEMLAKNRELIKPEEDNNKNYNVEESAFRF
jgi:hypothetical protein